MAVQAQSRRIDTLAQHKTFHPNFLEDRRSLYWIDKMPAQPGGDGITVSVLTPHQAQLVYPKMAHKEWQCDRYTGSYRYKPIIPVSKGAMSAEASERVAQLAQHKNPPQSFEFDRSVYTEVSRGAKKAEASERIAVLATPKKNFGVVDFRAEHPDWFWADLPNPISRAALKANCTERVETLALHKGPHFQDREVIWIPSETAKKAIATLRVNQLARPRSRTKMPEEFDPYKVSIAARRANATPRVSELSLPIPRKVRSKKNV